MSRATVLALVSALVISTSAVAGESSRNERQMKEYAYLLCEAGKLEPSVDSEQVTDCKKSAVEFLRKHSVPCADSMLRAYRMGLSQTLCAELGIAICSTDRVAALISSNTDLELKECRNKGTCPSLYRALTEAGSGGGRLSVLALLEREKRRSQNTFQEALTQRELDLELTGKEPAALTCGSARQVSSLRGSKTSQLPSTVSGYSSLGNAKAAK